MKNFNQFILTLLAAGLLASCSLTEEPTSFVNRKSFYKNESQCIAALNSCYMPANAIYTANFMLVTEACTDIWYSSSTTVDACLDVTPAKPQYGKNVWTQGYKGVMYCNECVECISSADLADGVKMPLAAEARVMRAFYYYVLTCMFGDVPFYTTMVDTDQRLAEIRRLPRTPAHEIRQELYDDLERNALPWFTAENGRKCRASEAVDNRSGYALALMLMAKFATAPAPNVNSSTTSSVTPILRPRWDFSSKMFSFRLDKGVPLLSDFLGECGYSASSPGTYGIRKQFT